MRNKRKETRKDPLKIGKTLGKILKGLGIDPSKELPHEVEIAVVDARQYFEEILPSHKKMGFKKIVEKIESRIVLHLDQIKEIDHETAGLC